MRLAFKADWGMANLTRLCGWITTELYWRAGLDSAFTIHTGRGYVDNLAALLSGEVDVAVVTPLSLGEMASRGLGVFAAPHSELRALGVLPHHDHLVLAVRADSRLSSYDDVLQPAAPLTLVTAPNDGVNMVGAAWAMLLASRGLTEERWTESGGRFVRIERPRLATDALQRGDAEAIFFEAFMTRAWRQLGDAVPLRFLSLPPDLVAASERWGGRVVDLDPDGRAGFAERIRTLEWGGWLLVCRANLGQDAAQLIVDVLIEARDTFEREYRGFPAGESPLSYPIRPEALASTGAVPLHPGAAASYRMHGVAL